MKKQILYGTTNQSKIDKLKVALTGYPVEILSLLDLNIVLKVDEIGNSTEENSLLKAKTYLKKVIFQRFQ